MAKKFERCYSKLLKMNYDIYTDGKIRTQDHVEYSPEETKIIKQSGSMTLDLHLLKKVFEGRIVNG